MKSNKVTPPTLPLVELEKSELVGDDHGVPSVVAKALTQRYFRFNKKKFDRPDERLSKLK